MVESSELDLPEALRVQPIAFASKAVRFKISPKKEFPGISLIVKLGPGSYNIESGLPRSYKRKAECRQVTGRAPTAPSIPSHDFVFGYEETPSGDLVKQQNPDKTSAKATIGPGEYEVEQAKAKGTNWHASKVYRPILLKPKENNIGPGSYEIQYTIASNKGHGTSCFKSAVPKLALKEASDSSEDEELPGPGHYNPRIGAFERRSVTSQVQRFGLTAARFTERCKTDVGPGQYNNMTQINVRNQ